uniref:Nuclear factor of activated T-cells 5 n=1 Tax=Aceria tosichella TaxID=561515 RepID=A0A6G1SKJ2_9ACAR
MVSSPCLSPIGAKLTPYYSSKSVNGRMELVIVSQPEEQHRARYLTEGSRGAIKDITGMGHPVVKLNGYYSRQPIKLECYIGHDKHNGLPHLFYQASKISGKNSTQCTACKVDGTSVIVMNLLPEHGMQATIDCIGILKERNVDVEQKLLNLNHTSKMLDFAAAAAATAGDDNNHSYQSAFNSISRFSNGGTLNNNNNNNEDSPPTPTQASPLLNTTNGINTTSNTNNNNTSTTTTTNASKSSLVLANGCSGNSRMSFQQCENSNQSSLGPIRFGRSGGDNTNTMMSSQMDENSMGAMSRADSLDDASSDVSRQSVINTMSALGHHHQNQFQVFGGASGGRVPIGQQDSNTQDSQNMIVQMSASNGTTAGHHSSSSSAAAAAAAASSANLLALNSRRRSVRCRLVFRVKIPETGEILQTTSSPIICTQPLGTPEICKKSLARAPIRPSDDLELFIIGKNFLKDSKVVFRSKHGDWIKVVEPEKEFLNSSHMICRVPSYDGPLEGYSLVQAVGGPNDHHHQLNQQLNEQQQVIETELQVRSGGKLSEPHTFLFINTLPRPTLAQQQQQQQQYQNQQQQYQNQEQQQQQQVEADLTIKVDGCTIVYLCVDDFKTGHNQQQQQQHQRNTRSIHSSNSIVDEAIEYLKRQPVAFNRGFNVNINERLAKVLDVDANILAGLRFESRAQGHSQEDFEIVAQMEPRFSFEAVVGPAKMSSKKLLQRLSTKTALGLRLRFKKDQLIDVQVDLPMNTMELFTVETQLVERSDKTTWSYNYLPESIYGQEDIYSTYATSSDFSGKLVKRSIAGFGTKKSTISQLYQGKGVSHSYETSPQMARATGLNAKLRVAASPKDMSFLASAVVEKYEQEMQGYRVKVEKSGGRTSADQETYMVTFSTPGSRTDRTMQMRLTTQAGQQRSLVKAEIQSARQSAGFVAELVHDGRQYSIKSELASRAGKQWRHAAEFGFVQTQQSGGRLSSGFSYKPYAQIESTSMKRPVQLQGQVAYTQSPKSVISYELKCPTSGSFVQGKLIFDQRDSKPTAMKTMRNRRSMQSPIEMIVSKDLTLTNEFIAQINKHAVKVHNMLDWDCQKYSLQGDSYATYKNMRQSGAQEQQVSASMKVDQEQQSFTVERKCPQDERKQFAARLTSKVRPTGHQMEAECRYNGRRQSLVAYKHKVDVQEVANNKYEAQMELELVDTERQIAEKAQGRVRISAERKMKQVQAEVSSPNRQMSAKFTADYQSVQQHQLQLQVQSNKFQHKTELRNTQRQFAVQSRTEQPATGKVYYKMQVDAQKQAPVECKIVVEAPQKRVALAADLKLASGKRSSLAIQGGRFASSVEFSFDDSQNTDSTRYNPFQRAANFRLRSNLKDLVNKQAYWMDSQLNAATFDKDSSFVRLDSPYYRTDIEYDPRAQETKVNAYGRTKRSTDQFNSIYSSPMIESLISQASDKLQLGPSKLWMLRSIVSSPYGRDQLKQKARRALFEYADRRQAHKHAFDWSPEDEQVKIDFNRQPNTEFDSTNTYVEPIRMKAALSTRGSRPSSAMLESPWMSAEMEAKPFFENDDEDDYQQNKNNNNQDNEVYAKITALSRHPRSAFKKHESEIRYKRDQGYKAHMKHQDSQDKRHELRAETASNPKSWSRVAYESDKHGKTNWEHKWRQQQKKRSTDQEDVYANEFSLKSEGPADNKWQHETSFKYEEPTRMASRRHRRSVSFYSNDQNEDNTFAAYPMEYLKHASARLSSKQSFANKKYNSNNNEDNKYQLDFDYQPQANYASLNMDMPQGMKHASSVEIKPSERLYKIQSRLYNRHTNQPSYELLASTKPYVSDLATANQEPVFVHSSHPMLERPIDTKSLSYKLFKQPLKLDYSDKYGRQASFDYDHMQEAAEATSTSGRRIAGLRQKRAAVYYKDAGADFEHSASYDFYPEALLAKAKPSFYAATSGQMMPVAIKTNTKYGPIVVRAESDSDNCRLDMESPLMSAKFAAQTGATGQRQLYTVQIDNKQQRVQLAKLVRDYAPETVRSSKMVKKFVREFDTKRFEHQAEVLASIADQIFKIKAQSKQDGRTELTIEAEYNKQTEKAYAKINGERVTGQAAVDLARKTAELKLDTEAGKHGNLHHVTRLVQASDKYYSLESMTTRDGRPVYKLTGRVSAKMFEPEHLFSSRRGQSGRGENHADHQSTFEAVIYEPKEIHARGEFNCETKEGRVVFHDEDEKKTQETKIRYDDETETFYASAQLSSQREGQIYAAKAKLNLPGLFQADECMRYGQQQTCKSEIVYSDNKTQGAYAVQYYPGEQVTANTPYGKFGISLAY